MAIIHHYQNPTTGTTIFDDVVDTIRIGAFAGVEDGQLGSVAAGSVAIDDVAGDATYLPWQRWHVLEDACPAALVLTGTLAKTSGSLTVVGSGTAFLSELAPGDEVVVPGGASTDYLFVGTVTDDTHFDALAAAGASASGQTGHRAAQQRIFSGWTGDYDIGRGDELPEGGNDGGLGRVWSLSLADVNTALHFRIGRGAAWGKGGSIGGATTTGARLAAVLAVSPISSLIFDDGLVVYYGTACEADNLANQYLDEILNTIAQVDGANFTLDYHEATGHLQLIYRKPVTTAFLPSPLRISSNQVDEGADLVLAPIDPHVQGASGGIFAGIQVEGSRASSYVTRAATADEFEWRDVNSSNSTLKSSTTRVAYGNRQLDDAESADEKIALGLVVPKAQMHLVRRMHQVQVDLAELPGWSGVWARILRREVAHFNTAPRDQQPAFSPDFYLVKLILGPAKTPPVPVATFAVVYRSGVPIDFIGGGDYEMVHDGTGDVPPTSTSYPIEPKYGPIDYLLAAPYGSSHPVGFTAAGAGPLHAQAELRAELGYNFGTLPGTTCWLEVRVNGATAASSPIATDPGSNVHLFVPHLVLDADITVADTDQVILFFCLRSLYITGIASIPIAGTFAPPYEFSVLGSLA